MKNGKLRTRFLSLESEPTEVKDSLFRPQQSFIVPNLEDLEVLELSSSLEFDKNSDAHTSLCSEAESVIWEEERSNETSSGGRKRFASEPFHNKSQSILHSVFWKK